MKARKLLKDILGIFMTMLLLSLLVFAMQAGTNGDSSSYMLSEEATDEAVNEYRMAYNLDGNIVLRYLTFLTSFFSFDWGNTLSGIPIKEVIINRVPVTLSLTLFSLMISLLVSLPWAMASVIKKGGFADSSLSIFSIVISSLPSFLIALVLSLVFGLWLKWFPVSGYISPFNSISSYLRSLFLPSITLASLSIPIFLRIFRTSLLDNLNKPYTLALKAQGAKRKDLVLFSALKPCLPVMISLIFQCLATSLSGSAIIESVFALPGLGSLMVNAALSRDIELASIIMMLVALSVSCLFLISDILSEVADPRLRRLGNEKS